MIAIDSQSGKMIKSITKMPGKQQIDLTDDISEAMEKSKGDWNQAIHSMTNNPTFQARTFQAVTKKAAARIIEQVAMQKLQAENEFVEYKPNPVPPAYRNYNPQ